MTVNFLDLLPKPPTKMVRIETRAHGPQEVELSGIAIRDLAAIATRFPAFAKILDGGLGPLLEHPDAMAAIIAAALGHAGDQQYETHVKAFPTSDILKMSFAIVELTYPQRDAVPLSPPPAVNGADGTASDPSSPSPLSN